jgi:hypothetical protein
MGVSESREMDERVDTGVTAAEDWSLKQARPPLPSAVEQLVKRIEDGRIRGQLYESAADGAVRSPLAILNVAFRPRHEVLRFC